MLASKEPESLHCFGLTIHLVSFWECNSIGTSATCCRLLGTWGAKNILCAVWNIGMFCPCKPRMLTNQESGSQTVLLSQVPGFVSDWRQLAVLALCQSSSWLLEFHWDSWDSFSSSGSPFSRAAKIWGSTFQGHGHVVVGFSAKFKNCTSDSVLHCFDYSYKSDLPILSYLNFAHPCA